MEAVLKALAAPRRRAILRLVWSAERSAGEIHRAFDDVTFGAVSQHLRVLAEAGLVEVRAAGRARLYRARKQDLGALAADLPWHAVYLGEWEHPRAQRMVRFDRTS